MKILKIYNQSRRDCYVDLECESCEYKETLEDGYDDRNYWENVVPNMKCDNCNESTNSIGHEPTIIPTKYPEGIQI